VKGFPKKEKALSSEPEIQEEFEKIRREFIAFLDNRYPVSMHFLKKVFGYDQSRVRT